MNHDPLTDLAKSAARLFTHATGKMEPENVQALAAALHAGADMRLEIVLHSGGTFEVVGSTVIGSNTVELFRTVPGDEPTLN